jgi:hypothetical protein
MESPLGDVSQTYDEVFVLEVYPTLVQRPTILQYWYLRGREIPMTALLRQISWFARKES